MTQPTETFCAAMNDVSCGVCPLRQIAEADWVEAAGPGKTPEEAAADVGHVAIEVADDVANPVDIYAAGDPDPEMDYAEEGDFAAFADEGGLGDVDLDERVEPAVLAGMQLHDRGWEISAAADQPDHPVAQAVGTCATKFADRTCATLDPALVAKLGERTAGMGADQLWRVATHGSDQEVARVIGRLDGWAAGQDLAINVDDNAPVNAYRAFLLRVAASVRAAGQRPAE